MKQTNLKYKKINSSNKRNNKTIIMYHGWGSTIESQVGIAEELAKIGFDIIIPEIIFHDNREPLENPFEKETMLNYFWKTIFYSIEEIDEWLSVLEINRENTILYGSSMGGFITSGIFFAYPGFAGLININGSGSYIFSEQLFRKMDKRAYLVNEELDLFMKYDPINKIESIDRPILLMHGENDQIIPIEGQTDFYQKASKLIGNENLRFQIFKEVNHSISNTMIEDLVKWLESSF